MPKEKVVKLGVMTFLMHSPSIIMVCFGSMVVSQIVVIRWTNIDISLVALLVQY